MAPKDQFSEYDHDVSKRKSNLEEEIVSEFRQRIVTESALRDDFSRQMLAKQLSSINGRNIPAEISLMIKHDDFNIIFLRIPTCRIYEETCATNYKRYCRANFYELSSDIGSLKSEEDKKQHYLRFLDQVQFLYSNTKLFQDDTNIGQFLRTLHVPANNDERKKLECVLRKIKNAGFLQDKVASRIQKYLTSLLQKEMLPEEKQRVTNPVALEIETRPSIEKESRTKEDSRAKEESKVEEVQKNKLNRENPEEILEYLTDLFELKPKVARKYISDVSLTELIDLHDKLGSRVDSAYIAGLIQINPEILKYKQTGDLSTYLKLLKQVQTRIGLDSDKESELKEEFGIENNLKAYSNLEELLELKEELYNRTKTEVEIEDTQTHRGKIFAKYTLLHRSDSLVEERLTNLIDKGEITVEEHEYWNSKHSGARSFHVVKKIIFQMMGLFSDLELGEPDYIIVRGQRKLILEPETMEQLRRARDEAYALQRERAMISKEY